MTAQLNNTELAAGAIFSPEMLRIDAGGETERIGALVREQVLRRLKRRGAVVGLSGGVDSSVTAALCARALGGKNVLAVFMPEKDSDPESLRLGRLVADALGIATVLEDIAPQLVAAGCYERRDSFIRTLVPEFGPGWACKVVIANALISSGYNLTSLVVQSPNGTQKNL